MLQLSKFALAIAAFAVGFASPVSEPALADPLSVREANRALYSTRGSEVEVVKWSFMTERDPDLLRTVAEALIYYAAIAAAPDEGIFSPATLGAANHHRMEDAEVAAKAACDAAKNSEAACVVVTRIRPRGWSPKSLQLSHDATTVFRKEFRRANGPKAFAVARGASRYGYSVSASSVSVAEQQALESCGDPACAIVILGE